MSCYFYESFKSLDQLKSFRMGHIKATRFESFSISSLNNSQGKSHPPTAASLHFELYKSSENEHYFQIFYRKSNEEYPTPMKLPGCGEKCALKQFYELYNDIIPEGGPD